MMQTPKVPAPVLIRVSAGPVRVSPEPKLLRFRRGADQPAPEICAQIRAQVRIRYSAKFVGGPFNGLSADGFESPDEAIGALIVSAAGEYDSVEDVLAFVSSLFGTDPARSWQEHLSRAVRYAVKHPSRVHPGVKVLMPDTQPADVVGAIRDSGNGGVA